MSSFQFSGGKVTESKDQNSGYRFRDNPALRGREDRFVLLDVPVAAVLESWKVSLFAHEWLRTDGHIRTICEMTEPMRERRARMEDLLRSGEILDHPVLGIGVMDNIEIGSGKDLFLCLAHEGFETLRVHVPKSHLHLFEALSAGGAVTAASKTRARRKESGSAFFIILVVVVLFAALSYAVSRDNGGTKSLSQERVRLLASEILDTGNRLSDAVARMRLHGIADTAVSFENGGSFINAGCLNDTCKVFSSGGGLDVESAPVGANGGEAWGFTGDLAITNAGTSAADLVALLPNISADVCHRINVLTGIEAESDSPPSLATSYVTTEFTGSYNGTPLAVTNAAINGQKSGCFEADMSGSAIPSISGGSGIYVFFQVLAPR